MLPKEVFLSHSSLDHDFATSLADVLKRHGIPVWFSQQNIVGAQQWHDEIGAALNRCDWFMVVLSPHSVEAKWVKRELMFALQEDRFENKIIPLYYQDCEVGRLSWVLRSFQMVDFRQDFGRGCRDLLRIWGLGYQPVE